MMDPRTSDRLRVVWIGATLILAACGGAPELASQAPGARSEVLPASEQASPRLIELVRLGYGDLHELDVRSLHFQTERLTTAQARAVVALVPSYNSFEGARVAEGIGRFQGRVAGWRFGREGSPVLIAELPYWTTQRERAGAAPEKARISDDEHQELVEAIRATFVDELLADEFAPMHGDSHQLRLWWD